MVDTKLIINDDENNLLVFKESKGEWIRANDNKAKKVIYGFIPIKKRAAIKDADIDNIIRKLKCDPSISVDLSYFEECNKNYLNVLNGVIDLDNGKLTKHDSKKYFTYCLDFEYKPSSDIKDSKSFMKYVSTSLVNNDNKRIRLLEIIGYAISSLHGAEKCFMFIGVSNSGKSVILNLIERIVGEENTTNFQINKLGDRFVLGGLKNSRVNINREISGAELKDLDIFKSICSGERLSGEKKHGDPFSFRCKCKLLFAGNCLPEIKKIDSSNNEAVFNRFCVLYFPKGLQDAEKDLTLEDTMFDERNIIFSASVKALMELKKRNFVFTEDPESCKYLDSYKESNQALIAFVKECCVFGKECKVHVKDFIDSFKKYCSKNAIAYLYTNESINSYISSFENVQMKKFRLNGSTPLNGFKGIGLKADINCYDMAQD